jgi:hypothetical protein
MRLSGFYRFQASSDSVLNANDSSSFREMRREVSIDLRDPSIIDHSRNHSTTQLEEQRGLNEHRHIILYTAYSEASQGRDTWLYTQQISKAEYPKESSKDWANGLRSMITL